MEKKTSKKSGITLFILMLTIGIMLVILAAVSTSFLSISRSTKQREFASEIYQIQKLVEQYYFLNNKYPVIDSSDNIILDLNSIQVGSREQFDKEPGFKDYSITLKELNLYEAGVQEANRGIKEGSDNTDIYVVSQETGVVYYLKGVRIGSKTYYGLNDELKEKLDIK